MASTHIDPAPAEVPVADQLRRYELLNLATQEGIWDYDLRDKRSTYNDAMCALFGYSRREMRNNQVWWTEHIHPTDRDRVTNEMRQVMESASNTWYGEYRFRKKDGNYVDVFERLYVVRDNDAKPIRLIGTMQDLSHFKLGFVQMQEKRQVHKQQILRWRIESEEKERKEISEELHENINQLLAALRLYIKRPELLQKASSVQHDAESILLELMRDIRTLSRRLFPLGMDILGLRSLVDEQLESLAAKKVIYQLKFEEAVEAISLEQKTLIYRIFVEQMQNLILHSQASKVWVEFRIRRSRLYFSLRDNGIGANPETLDFRNGLGRVENIIDAFNGDMHIITHPGKGFELRVTL